MLHRAILGSLERFIGVLLEHYSGALPFWLSPTQAVVIPISQKQNDYANLVEKKLKKIGFRVKTDLRNDKIGFKIRDLQKKRYPYLLIVGQKESETNTISIRSRDKNELGVFTIDDFINLEKE